MGLDQEANGAGALLQLAGPDPELDMATVEDLNAKLEVLTTNVKHLRDTAEQVMAAVQEANGEVTELRERVIILEQEKKAREDVAAAVAKEQEKVAQAEQRAEWVATLEKWGLRIGAILGAGAGGTHLLGG